MLLAIESFVRLFEKMLIETAAQPEPRWHADNDNDDAAEDDRRWATYR